MTKFLICLASAAVLGTGISDNGRLARARPGAEVFDGRGTSIPVLFNCGTCEGCGIGNNGHRNPYMASGGANKNPHGDCLSAGCLDPACPVTAVGDSLVLVLLDRVADGDKEAARHLVDHYPEKVSFNPVRRSLQLQGCESGVTIANVPIGEELTEALELRGTEAER